MGMGFCRPGICFMAEAFYTSAWRRPADAKNYYRCELRMAAGQVIWTSRRSSGCATALCRSFSRYDAMIPTCWPIPAHSMASRSSSPDGQTVDATYLQGATVPLNRHGLPGVAMRFGTRQGGDADSTCRGCRQWQAESTILHVASLLESIRKVRNLHSEALKDYGAPASCKRAAIPGRFRQGAGKAHSRCLPNFMLTTAM